MKPNKSVLVSLAVAVIAAAAAGCKKDDESSSYEYLEGHLRLSVAEYANPGYSKTFQVDSMMTLSSSDGSPVGYYFKNGITNKYDTLYTAAGEFRKHLYTFEIPDTIGVVSLTFGAYSDGEYYGSTVSRSVVVVQKGLNGEKTSLTGYDIKDSDRVMTDPRDGRSYYTSAVDGTEWMRQNLAWDGGGEAFMQCEATADVFGRYYTWTEALSACPEGWRLPSEDDWLALGKAYGSDAVSGRDFPSIAGKLIEDVKFNGKTMWEFSRNVRITNESRLSMLPLGYASVDSDGYEFHSMYTYCAFWSSDESAGMGAVRYISQGYDSLYYGLVPKDGFAASVRCVRDIR